MGDYNRNTSDLKSFLARSEIGTTLTILSGLAFLLLSMFLPLVGKAGAKTAHYATNYTAFLLLLLLTLGLSGLAIKSKLDRRKIDGSPFPLMSSLLGALCVLLLIALLFGLLKI